MVAMCSALSMRNFPRDCLKVWNAFASLYPHEKLDDRERYQTVYAKENWLSHCSTYGTHFTKELLKKPSKGVHLITAHDMHVGLKGPLGRSVDRDRHEMHSSFINCLKKLLRPCVRSRKMVAVSLLWEQLLSVR